jgi:hypothetical protein
LASRNGSRKRMPNRLSLAGRRFGKWTVVRFSHLQKRGNSYWLCRCDCGNCRRVPGCHLNNGRTRSCSSCAHRTHGLSRSAEMETWASMIQRCTNSKNHAWKDYGGRGIRVCRRWLRSFSAFYSDMGPRPRGRTLDRRNNDGDYRPGNCRWATWLQQGRNRRSRCKP